MFPRRERLPRAQFTHALKRGRRFSSKHLSFIVPPKESEGYAVVIPKKIIRKSVDRHKLKRQLFEALKAVPRPEALIIFLRTAPGGVHYKDLVDELKNALATNL